MEPFKIYYGFLLPSGKLARISTESTGGAQFCNDVECKLTDDSNDPIFMVENQEALETVLVEDTPWYNSSPNAPNWGGFKRDDLRPVRLSMAWEEAPEVGLPAIIEKADLVESCDLPWSVVKLYVHAFDVPKGGRWSATTLKSPSHKYGPLVGKTVWLASKYLRKQLMYVIDLPDDWPGHRDGVKSVAFFRETE